jgi:hypothetical protein
MTYMVNGKQYIVVAVGWKDMPGEFDCAGTRNRFSDAPAPINVPRHVASGDSPAELWDQASVVVAQDQDLVVSSATALTK